MGGTQSQRAEIIYEHSEEEFNETKDKLAEIVEMNYKVFNQLSHNASHLTKALMQRKKDIAQSIFNFISQGDHVRKTVHLFLPLQTLTVFNYNLLFVANAIDPLCARKNISSRCS